MSSVKKSAHRVVIKLGTGVLTQGVGQLDLLRMEEICSQVAHLKTSGFEVIMVSSGAVGLGMGKLGLKVRPKKLAMLQTCAAVGQGILIQTWAKLFEKHSIIVAQLLLTRDDVDFRNRHEAMRDMLNEILSGGIVPIINENDCVSAAELNIKFGDNDVLSALVSVLSNAQNLVILSTAPGLIDMGGTEKVIPVVKDIDSVRSKALGTSSATAVGGMITKLKAADIATASACAVHIASGAQKNVLIDIFDGKEVGTCFLPKEKSKNSKKKWLAYFGKSIGHILVDEGAQNAIKNKGSSLLLAGVKSIKGNFHEGALVEIASATSGEIFARGLAKLNSAEIEALLSKHVKGQDKDVLVVHRDNLSMI